MNKKYTLKREGDFYRLFALKSFRFVRKGDKGGLVAGPDNLSQEGNCWIYKYAKVIEDGMVVDDAIVYGKARVSGYALIKGKARVSGHARIKDGAVIAGHARVRGEIEVTAKALITGDVSLTGKKSIGDCQIIE